MTENNKSTKNSIFNRITAISTIFIACTAVGISIWQGWETRRHNKLSVKPILEIHTSTTEAAPLLGVWVENCGTGPAIIKDMIVYFDGQPIKVDSKEKAENIYRSAIILIDKVGLWHPHGSGAVLKQGGKANIISYAKENWTIDGKEKFKKALSHLHFKFIYESVYTEKFEASNEVQ